MRRPHPSEDPELFSREPGSKEELEEAKLEAGVSSELDHLERLFLQAYTQKDKKLLESITPRLEAEYIRRLTNLKSRLDTADDKEPGKITKEIQSIENRQLDFEIKLGKPGVEQKIKQIQKSLPYLFVDEPELLARDREEIKTLKFPISYPKTPGNWGWRAYRTEIASQLYNIQAIGLDKNFLDAEESLINPNSKEPKEAQWNKLNASYVRLFNNLHELLTKGQNFVARKTITAMELLFERRQNLIRAVLPALELQQKMISKDEILKTAQAAGQLGGADQFRYMLSRGYIEKQIPENGIFGDRLSLRSWAETIRARYEYGPIFHRDYISTLSTGGFEVFDEQLSNLTNNDQSDKGLMSKVEPEPVKKRRGRPRK